MPCLPRLLAEPETILAVVLAAVQVAAVQVVAAPLAVVEVFLFKMIPIARGEAPVELTEVAAVVQAAGELVQARAIALLHHRP